MGSPPIKDFELSPLVAPLEVRDGRVQYRAGETPRRKVAIFGGGPSIEHVPWDDPDWEIWAINNFWGIARDMRGKIVASRWWEIHQISDRQSGPSPQDANDMQWINACPVPIYTVEDWPKNPHAVRWPLEDMLAKGYRDFFACTFAYQIVQALEDGFDELGVFGLELAFGTKRETTVERACVSYWLGLAEGRGMKITIPEDDVVLRHWGRYGFEYWEEANETREYCQSYDLRDMAH